MIRPLFLVCLLGAVSLSLAQAPQVFEAAVFQKAVKTATLVDDPATPGHQVVQLADSAMDFGYSPAVQPGLYRLTLRLRTTTSATGTIKLFVSSGNWKKSPYYREDPPDITGEEFPQLNAWYEISRLVRFAGDGYWGGVTGGWKGLQIDRFTVARVTEPVLLLGIRTNKLLYPLNEAGSVVVKLVNTTGEAQAVRLNISVENGLAHVSPGTAQTVTLPAATPEQRAARQDAVDVTIPLPSLAEYGNAVTVRVVQGDKLIGAMTEYCYCSNRPVQVGQYFGWSFPGDYTCSNAPGHFETMRRTYFPIAECFFWAPCDNSAQVPEGEKWWSGQTLLKLAKKPLQEMIAQGHAQGFSFVSYATRWGFGQRVWEYGRKHPDQVEWEVPGFQLSYSVSHMEIERREKDEEYTDLGSSGILTAAWGNPDSVAYHVKTLQDSMKMFGWDGFRYDNGSPVIDEVEDVFGRKLPLPGWDHAKCIALLRSGPRQVKPGAIYGNNTGWNLDMDSQPYADDPYTQQTRDGGLIMQEGETIGGWGHKPFTEEANRYFRAGYNALRFGGQQYNIINPYLVGADHFYQAALTVAGSCHICYHVRDELRPLMQLVCRHCDLFYGDGLRFVLKPESMVSVTAPPQILWRDYVRYRQLSSTRRIYLVHLINLPPGAKIGESKGQYPESVPGISTVWTLPAGWQAARAYQLTSDGGYHSVSLPIAGDGGKVKIVLPELRRYSLLVFEATGPALPIEPTLTPMATIKPNTDGASMSSAANIALLEKSPADAVGQVVHYSPSELLTKPFTLTMAKYFAKRKEVTVIDDPEATSGKALKLGDKGFSSDDFGYGPSIPGIGHYRLTLRLKATQPPPANGIIYGFISSANNNATPGAKFARTDFKFTAVDFQEVGKWVNLTLDCDMTYPNYWGGFTGGWPGLVVDSFTITRLHSLDKAEFTSYITTRWPDNLGLTPHDGVKVWYGAGLYYEYYHLQEALAKLGAQTTVAKTWRFRGPAGFDVPFPKTPEELAGYDLVILADAEARMLTPVQQQWLDAFTLRGGHVLLLGGPYAFGCGGWQDSGLLADMYPVTLHAHDLEFVGKAAPLPLTPVSALLKGRPGAPVVCWLHAATAKPGAVVHATAGGKPAIVTASYGKGQVGVVLIVPLGEVPAGATTFWNWSEWPSVMEALCRALLK